MGWMEIDHHKTPLYKPCHIVALFDFAKMFLNKENCFWEQVKLIKQKLRFFNTMMMYWRFGTIKVKLSSQRTTVPTLKHGGSSMSRIRQLIAIRGLMKSEDYI